MTLFGTILLLCQGDVNTKLRCTVLQHPLVCLHSSCNLTYFVVVVVAVAFGMFDFENKGRSALRADEIIMFMNCSLRGLAKVPTPLHLLRPLPLHTTHMQRTQVKKLEEPPLEHYVMLVEGRAKAVDST